MLGHAGNNKMKRVIGLITLAVGRSSAVIRTQVRFRAD